MKTTDAGAQPERCLEIMGKRMEPLNVVVFGWKPMADGVQGIIGKKLSKKDWEL
jgi:hypothetical protein